MALANEENMSMFIRCGIMALVAAYLNFLSQMIANPAFCQHVSKVSDPAAPRAAWRVGRSCTAAVLAVVAPCDSLGSVPRLTC